MLLTVSMDIMAWQRIVQLLGKHVKHDKARPFIDDINKQCDASLHKQINTMVEQGRQALRRELAAERREDIENELDACGLNPDAFRVDGLWNIPKIVQHVRAFGTQPVNGDHP